LKGRVSYEIETCVANDTKQHIFSVHT
jgi:hypothetical protein